MNGYKAYYNGGVVDVYAKSSYEAQTVAAKLFRVSPKNQYKITVVLAKKNGNPVIHNVSEFGG